MDYQNGKIYRLVSNVSDKQYIGSTITSLSKRLYQHKSNYKCFIQGSKQAYISSFDVIEEDDYDIILIEEYPCQNKNELERRERFYIESMDCINRKVPCKGQDENYHKAYYQEKKDKIKQYYQDNKDRISQRNKEMRALYKAHHSNS